MRSVIKLLQLLGFWTQPYQKRSSAKPLAFTTLYIGWLLFPGIIYIFRQQPSFAVITRTAVESMSIANIIMLIVSTIFHQPVLGKAYGDVRFALAAVSDSLDRELQRTIDHLELSTDRFFKGYIGFQMAVGLIYCSSNPIQTIVKYVRSEELPPLHGILEADFYIFDYTSNFWLWLLVVGVGGLSLLSIVVVIVSINSLHWSLIHHIAGLFKIIRRRLSNLNAFSKEKSCQQELVDIIELHEVVYRSARSLEQALNVYMLMQFGTCIVMLCLTLMVLVLANDDRDLLIKMILMLSYILSHILVYSMLGSELMSASASVADAVHEVSWYQWPVGEQRKLLFVLSRSQRITALTTGKFFYLNRETFGMTLRTTMSYFTVLMQMYGAK
ncbi:uncharacterized protein LOC109430000 [Aedes albopictus]|uniref:Odorant receptor n=1 Tax=Aedes albopictus TaxID=7160 RepID=A0ABM1XYE7_AEDAL